MVIKLNSKSFETFDDLLGFQIQNTWASAGFGDFREKTPKRTWICAGISLVRS